MHLSVGVCCPPFFLLEIFVLLPSPVHPDIDIPVQAAKSVRYVSAHFERVFCVEPIRKQPASL